MTGQLPTRLTTQPIIDAIVEVRFKSSVDASLLLPGLIVQQVSGSPKVERLPLADLPAEVRFDSDLKHQPLIRILTENFVYLIGSHSFCVGCLMPYPGWAVFKDQITSAFTILANANIVTEIDRYSMKYVDLFEFRTQEEAFDHLNVTVDVAGGKATGFAMNLNVLIPDKGCHHLLNVGGPATVTLLSGVQRTGTIVQVDTVSEVARIPFGDFYRSLAERFDNLHELNKAQFFALLKPSALERLGAVYD